MNILIITAHPYMPQMYGGLQASADALAANLIKRGHAAAILSTLSGKGWMYFAGKLAMKLLAKKTVCDRLYGYPVWRAWFPWEQVGNVARAFKADAILVLACRPVRMALAAQKTGLPVVMKLQDVEFSHHDGEFRDLGKIATVANSSFTAMRYHSAYGVDPVVIHPLINPEKYRTKTARQNVTFINPHPQKGLALALAIAAKCPEIPFSFVETWPLLAEDRAALELELARLPNVTLHKPVRDMRKIYRKAKILLVPSQWEEAFGRVASEAQCSGIPVISSNRGGLAESVGDGGILLDPVAPLDDWVAAVKQLWHDGQSYEIAADKALRHAQRPEMNIDRQMQLWEAMFNKVIAKAQ